MEKITILCGMENCAEAHMFMNSVMESLVHFGCDAIMTNPETLLLETKNTRTCFFYDIRRQPLDGVRADAIFGLEPYKRPLAIYLKYGQPYDVGMGLVDYICKVEANAKYGKSIYITTSPCGRKSELWRRYMECITKKEPEPQWIKREFVEYSKADCDITYDLYKKLATNDRRPLPEIEDVIFNNPATIVKWADGTKTVVRTQDGEPYDPEKGLAMAMCKKMFSNKRDYYHIFKHWLKKA